MSAHCSNCGEELLGAVNRCWKCGATVVASTGTTDGPDARAYLADEPMLAETVGEPLASGSTAVDFATVHPPVQPQQQPSEFFAVPQRSAHRAKQSAVGGAVASIVLGVIGLSGALFTAAALLVSIPGMVLGLWGLASDKKSLAAIGLLICFLAILIGGYQAATWLYEDVEFRENEGGIEFEPIEDSQRERAKVDLIVAWQDIDLGGKKS